jgi:hypothetical protein
MLEAPVARREGLGELGLAGSLAVMIKVAMVKLWCLIGFVGSPLQPATRCGNSFYDVICRGACSAAVHSMDLAQLLPSGERTYRNTTGDQHQICYQYA